MSPVAVSIPTDPPSPPVPQGSPERIHDAADQLLRASAGLDNLDDLRTREMRPDAWQGAGGEAYREKVADAAADASAEAYALRRAAGAFRDYADTLERIKSRASDLWGWYSSIKHSLADLRGDAARATEDEAAEIRARASDLRQSRSNYAASRDALIADIAANDAALRSALSAVATIQQARYGALLYGHEDSLLNRAGAPGTGASPAEIAEWWRSLTPDQQLALISAHPEVIGAADGVPAWARDKANRLMLENDLRELELAEEKGLPYIQGPRWAKNVRAAWDALEAAEGRMGFDPSTKDPITGEPIGAFLHLYQPSAFNGDGAVALAIGNPDTAQNLATIVPGIMTDAASIGDYGTAARHLYESARLSDPYTSSAVIAWIGYDHPTDWDIGNTVTEAAAIDGGARLARYVDGLKEARTTEIRTHTVIGHSYGSTTSAHAASDHGLAVDNLVLIGSPGAGGGIDHASQLNVPQVFAGNNSRDIVAALADNGWVGGHTLLGAGLGNDVAEDTFGAVRFTAEDPGRNPVFRNIEDHVKYFNRGTESIYNMGQIMVGDYHEVVTAQHTYDPWWSAPIDPEATRTPAPLNLDRKPEW